MTFSAKQVQALRRNPDRRYIRTREINGRELSYLEGWYAVSEANRIFGFDSWSRETTEARCALARESRGTFTAVYIAKVRLTVNAGGILIIREGHGTGEGRASTPAEAHDTALKTAETDATKRALATFGRPFGLELYRGGKSGKNNSASAATVILSPHQGDKHAATNQLASTPLPPLLSGSPSPPMAPAAISSAPPSVPIPPRDGREDAHDIRQHSTALEQQADRPAGDRTIGPLEPALFQRSKIDKSALTFGEPKRVRNKAHLKFVASQPCLLCGRQPADAHHLRFTQPRALGLKVSDEFTVPLCRGHHRQLHQAGNEAAWWEDLEINAVEIAKGLWEQSRTPQQTTSSQTSGASALSESNPI